MNDDDDSKFSASWILAAQEGLTFRALQTKTGAARLGPAPLLPDNVGNFLLPSVYCQPREVLVGGILRVVLFVVWFDRMRHFLPSGAMQSESAMRQHLWNLVIDAVSAPPLRAALAASVGDWLLEPADTSSAAEQKVRPYDLIAPSMKGPARRQRRSSNFSCPPRTWRPSCRR